MIDWLNTNSGAVQALLVLVLVFVTAWYAWQTSEMAKATRVASEAAAEQAKASTNMAEEMRLQRLSTSQPTIIPIFGGAYHAGNQYNLRLLLRNIGNGPALSLIRTVDHPRLMTADGSHRHSQLFPHLLSSDDCDASFVLSMQAEHERRGDVEIAWTDIYGQMFTFQASFVWDESTETLDDQ